MAMDRNDTEWRGVDIDQFINYTVITLEPAAGQR